MKKIRLHPDFKKKLAEEFNVSYQTVTMSLNYVFESDKSDLIRDRAKEMLTEEANKITKSV
ncbi:hypothetical protein FIA58_014010 [Flavobacterium jejuense]|uniref:Transposase n=1 Tax=Flavobacterium jejuense TaxID=1544455 RepID=A0ABX0ITD9_9FLAO|nr:hypothetical protein [Flavobacterium jejuense]NHN26796.1 hypothetical protein [Flavobacterium jejuense]